MQKNLLIIACLIFVSDLKGQNWDNLWQLGTNPSNIAQTNYYIDFSSGIADADTLVRKMSFFNTNASICDTSGKLLFYSNGVYISNRNHDSLLNCHNFNPGYWTDFYDDGLGIPQGALILDVPGSLSNYGVFSVSGEYGNFYGKTFMPLSLNYSEVDMNLDGGLGGIPLNRKNIHVVEDSIMWGRITACKHANGRDWWIITHKFYSDKYYKIYFQGDSFSIEIQHIGNQFKTFDANGMAVFSPDGSKYAHLNTNDTIDLLQFDRCSGEFSTPIMLSVRDSSNILSPALGCQFSANSRFLYVNSYRRLWQFDTWSMDIQDSKILIDSTDNFEDKFLQQLAPDGKIYISTFNSNGQQPFLSVINKPDSLGSLCNFEIEGLLFPIASTNHCVPNFPNYNLGPLEGSLCDTISVSSDFSKHQVSKIKVDILPNPNKGKFTLHYHLPQNKEGIIEIINMQGRIEALFKRPMWSSILNADVNLAPGMYLVRLKSGGSMISKTMVVQ